ncbi:hypothetical protein ASG43_01020 [Aureimonas sp. Leaf454]|uniref:hypothetical protein n=1 Tax=Aureimonas sp. Leaf454 TaxID=1736381 RepID=UPI0006F2F9C8|nr:hypothetical protein [Aureimonas sp. Leaf454]KQT54241.1 hypothetical protein ASG43_01020 [Aureimonas sp. Leaf454]
MIPRAHFRKIPIVAVLVGSLLLGASLSPSKADVLRTGASLTLSIWTDAALPETRGSPAAEGVRMADADCSAAAAEAAAETGGEVLSVSSREEGGRTLCVVTVLVPGGEGERPRKRTITVPQ